MDWKTEFLELYISKQNGDFSKALDLKREHIPEKLYRYRDLERMSHIREEVCGGKIWLAHPAAVNDPFDACSLLRSKNPAEYMTDKAKFMSQFEGKLSAKEFHEIFHNDDWYDRLMSLCARESVSEDELGHIKDALTYAVMKELEEFNTLIRKTARFACFTERPDNLPMWNHYTQGHKGICLEYQTQDIHNPYTVNRLFPVFYTEKLPDGTSLMIDGKLPPYPFVDYFLMHKQTDWSYEKEWRLIYDVGAWYRSPEDVPDDFWDNGKHIQFICPSRIYLGAKIDAQNEAKVHEWGQQLGIPVQKMKCTEYGLEAAV